MTGLQPVDLERLKLLLAGKSLPMEAKVSILNILRSGIPDLFSGLTENQLEDINFLTKYLSDPFQKKKIKNALHKELYPSLSSTQQLDLEQALGEASTTAEEAGGQPTGQELPSTIGQEIQPTGTTGGSAGGMPSGLPSSPSFTPRHVFIARQTPPPKGGMAGGTGEGTAATNKIDRINKSRSTEASNLRSTAPQRFNFSNLRSRAGSVFKNFQNFASPAGPFLKTNLGRIGRGITGAGRAGLDAAAPSLGRAFHTGLNGIERIIKPGGMGGGGIVKSPVGKRVGIVIFLAFLLLIFATGFFSGIGETTPTDKASPPPSGTFLDYTLPLRDITIVPVDIRTAITNRWPNAQIGNWQTIIDRSIARGWNPALVLALWIEESGAQGENPYTDPLGCDPLHPTTDINISLDCLFNNFSDFTNDQFPQFMAKYSGGPPDNPFLKNPNFPGNIKDQYSKLVPSGPGAITPVATIASSCPTIGTISTPYGFNIPQYPDVANEGCGNLSRCHNGIDIAADYDSPIRSTIDGTIASLNYGDRIKGNYIEITDATANLKVTFEHLSSITVRQNTTVAKGDIVGFVGQSGAVTGPVLHYKIERGGVLMNPLQTLGTAATLDPAVLTSSDDIAQNDYTGRMPAGGTENWGQCN